MRDEDPILRNLETKQAVFFSACERRGLSLSTLSAALGEPLSTLSGYRPTPAKPKPNLMSLAMFIKIAGCDQIPGELANILIEDSRHQLAPIDAVAADWLGLGMRAAAFASQVCEFQATGGHIDHREDAILKEGILTIISEGHGAIAAKG
ncbi:hypothetical protein [Sphingomonas immobilis]|uniref:XRE family transcriptional regulator n=1 Tax=Sphingomonas immobilis TaxID=3063997 RepID=A0ABT8ZU61_9SPHN|nr:hypothetical protein [Sphingomonas sp. CA1-15]MDO7841104.1 hypothetical protein [Sphingomonas sp. CA1-15]